MPEVLSSVEGSACGTGIGLQEPSVYAHPEGTRPSTGREVQDRLYKEDRLKARLLEPRCYFTAIESCQTE